MAKNLYIGNLSFDTTEDSLRDLFAQAGTVTSCNLIMDRETNRPRGFAFVEMSSDTEAQKAISEFDGKDVDGRALKVNEAKPRENRGGGGGGGGRRDREFSNNRW